MKPTAAIALTLATCVALLLALSAQADELAPLSKKVSLKAHGGATFDTPAWKTRRGDDAIAILERTGAESRGAFTTLLLAIEEGPDTVETIDWDRVKDNIQTAAKDGGATLALTLGGAGPSVSGFRGQRLTGTMITGGREVDLHMVALIAPGVLVTVTAIGPRGDTGLSALVAGVSKTTTRATTTP